MSVAARVSVVSLQNRTPFGAPFSRTSDLVTDSPTGLGMAEVVVALASQNQRPPSVGDTLIQFYAAKTLPERLRHRHSSDGRPIAAQVRVRPARITRGALLTHLSGSFGSLGSPLTVLPRFRAVQSALRLRLEKCMYLLVKQFGARLILVEQPNECFGATRMTILR